MKHTYLLDTSYLIDLGRNMFWASQAYPILKKEGSHVTLPREISDETREILSGNRRPGLMRENYMQYYDSLEDLLASPIWDVLSSCSKEKEDTFDFEIRNPGKNTLPTWLHDRFGRRDANLMETAIALLEEFDEVTVLSSDLSLQDQLWELSGNIREISPRYPQTTQILPETLFLNEAVEKTKSLNPRERSYHFALIEPDFQTNGLRIPLIYDIVSRDKVSNWPQEHSAPITFYERSQGGIQPVFFSLEQRFLSLQSCYFVNLIADQPGHVEVFRNQSTISAKQKAKIMPRLARGDIPPSLLKEVDDSVQSTLIPFSFINSWHMKVSDSPSYHRLPADMR